MNSEVSCEILSVFEKLEHLQLQGEKLLEQLPESSKRPSQQLLKDWEEAYLNLETQRQQAKAKAFYLQEKLLQAKSKEVELKQELYSKEAAWEAKELNMQREFLEFRSHLEEGKKVWAENIQKIEEEMQEQERNAQKRHAFYQGRLGDIDKELDEILHLHKNKFQKNQKLGDILPSLFQENERKNLERSQQIDLQDSQSESEDLDLTGTQKHVFEKVKELRNKVKKFMDENSDSESQSESFREMPSGLKSLSDKESSPVHCASFQHDKHPEVEHSSEHLKYPGVVFGGSGSQQVKKELKELVNSDKLSISEREGIVYELISDRPDFKTNYLQKLTGTLKKPDEEPTEQLQELLEEPPKPAKKPKDTLLNEETWGDISSINNDTQVDISRESENFFNVSKHSFKKEDSAKENSDSFVDFTLAQKFNPKLSVTKEESTPEFTQAAGCEKLVFSKEKREPDFSKHNIEDSLSFIPGKPHSRNSSRVVLKPEESFLVNRPKLNKSNESKKPPFPKITFKPISMQNKLPMIPKPPDLPKENSKSVRGRSMQPLNPSQFRLGSSPGRRLEEQRSNSPKNQGFRRGRFKKPQVGRGFSNPARPVLKQ